MENSVQTKPVRHRASSKGAVWLALSAAFVLGACAGTPYVDSRREAGQKEPVGTSSPDMVAICYSGYATSPEQLMKLAESECVKTARVPQFSHEDKWACTMTAPTRAFYRCVAKP